MCVFFFSTIYVYFLLTLNRFLEVPVLRGITGVIKPGRLTLVLGPPGSGKSSFLKCMAGKLYNAPGAATLTGQLMYNGREVKNLKNLAAWVSYVRQTDEHQSILTTRETLEFAFRCRREARFKDAGLMRHLQSRLGADAVDKLQALKDIEVDICLAILVRV